MKRRAFLRATLAAVFGAPLLWVADKVVPARYTEALRARIYPGPVKPLDHASLKRPGKWAG